MTPIQLVQQSWDLHWLKLKRERWLSEGCAVRRQVAGHDPGIDSGDWLALSYVPLPGQCVKPPCFNRGI
jgi:hypothetical protein